MQIKNNYTFCQKFKLGWWLLRTKLICRKARLIRFPFDLRNAKFIDLGEGVVVMPGVAIGRGSVIRANSVVTKSIAADTIAAGQPAKPIKTYNFETKQWLKL